jgi:hypothetical protein
MPEGNGQEVFLGLGWFSCRGKAAPGRMTVPKTLLCRTAAAMTGFYTYPDVVGESDCRC